MCVHAGAILSVPHIHALLLVVIRGESEVSTCKLPDSWLDNDLSVNAVTAQTRTPPQPYQTGGQVRCIRSAAVQGTDLVQQLLFEWSAFSEAVRSDVKSLQVHQVLAPQSGL